jgi:hypothetical protein
MRAARRLSLLVALSTLAFGASVGVASACPPPPQSDLAASRSLLSAPSTLPAAGGDPFYYTGNLDPRPNTTHSKIPHLPVFTGFMGTNETFRFMSVAEQVFTLLGEGKHGLWRIQENGMIREYLRSGAEGLPRNADLSDPDNFSVIKSDYSHFLPQEGFDGYKDPFQPVNAEGRRNFIDLPITHRKYRGRYDRHVPIDLPHWYCTMSDANFPEAREVLNFAFAQKAANRIGPLGKRAGLDIEELYTNVLRVEPFPDAKAWVNVGDSVNVHWKAIDARKTNAEFYLYERPFFNVPYMFLTAVFDNKSNRDFRYVRPDGPYYEDLTRRGASRRLKTDVTLRPRFHVERDGVRRVAGTLLYGVHHPDRPAEYGASGGGACPQKGGDWDGYPDTKGGAGWPTQYEEVTPLCDGVLLDIKFFANLDAATWNDESKYLANAGTGKRRVTYNVQEGVYGRFTDPYLTEQGVENPHATHIGPKVVLKYRSVRKPVRARPVPK